MSTAEDGSRELVSLLAAICADGTAIPPTIIFKGSSGDIRSSWMQHLDEKKQQAYFGASENGWSSDAFARTWLTRVFHEHTKAKAGRKRRLLILDGHGSHVNHDFVNLAEKYRISVAVLPPHSTHRLQPLDVGVFSPLGKAYSRRLDDLIQSTHNFFSVKKSNFWPLFWGAWNDALTEENIRSAFEATGIHPFNPNRVLENLPKRQDEARPSSPEMATSTPRATDALKKRIIEAYQHPNGLRPDIGQILRGALDIAFDRDLLRIRYENLEQTVHKKVEKTKWGKPLGLINKDQVGEGQLFSARQVAGAMEALEEEEAERSRMERERRDKREERVSQRVLRDELRILGQIAANLLREEEIRTQKQSEEMKRGQRITPNQQRGAETLGGNVATTFPSAPPERSAGRQIVLDFRPARRSRAARERPQTGRRNAQNPSQP